MLDVPDVVYRLDDGDSDVAVIPPGTSHIRVHITEVSNNIITLQCDFTAVH